MSQVSFNLSHNLDKETAEIQTFGYNSIYFVFTFIHSFILGVWCSVSKRYFLDKIK